MPAMPVKIVVNFEPRPGGGLRAWSDDLPGLVLSHADVDAVIADVEAAIGMMIADRIGHAVRVEPLFNVRDALKDSGVVQPRSALLPSLKEYVAFAH